MEEYLDGLPPPQRVALERVRAVVTKVVPEAEEGVSYGVPAFIYEGRPASWVQGRRNHLSVFPCSPEAITSVKDRLEGFELSKGTIRFTPENPVPEKVLAEVVRARQQEITTNQ